MRRVAEILLGILIALFLMGFIFVVTTRAAEAVWGYTVKEWMDDGNATRKLYYVIGVADTLVALDLQCPSSPRFGEIIAWSDEQIYKNDLYRTEPTTGMMEVIARGMVAHGCKRVERPKSNT